jgi:hypothetical protein
MPNSQSTKYLLSDLHLPPEILNDILLAYLGIGGCLTVSRLNRFFYNYIDGLHELHTLFRNALTPVIVKQIEGGAEEDQVKRRELKRAFLNRPEYIRDAALPFYCTQNPNYARILGMGEVVDHESTKQAFLTYLEKRLILPCQAAHLSKQWDAISSKLTALDRKSNKSLVEKSMLTPPQKEALYEHFYHSLRDIWTGRESSTPYPDTLWPDGEVPREGTGLT